MQNLVFNRIQSLKLADIKAFFGVLLKEVQQERVPVSAGHLAYVSLLSLVPFIMVFFTILSAFPKFAEMRAQIEEILYTNFIPAKKEVVHTYINEFVDKASGMGAVGILGLMVVALLLISNIDKTLNHIFRATAKRPPMFTFAIYWMVLTLGPLLMGAGLAISSYLVGLANFADDYVPNFTTSLLSFVPFFFSLGAIFILYMVVPNRQIASKFALVGACVAALLFEFSKKGFALYISKFDSYDVIYGSMAAIPVLFVWVYLSWIVLLFGGIFTVTLEKFVQQQSELTGTGTSPAKIEDKAA